LSPEKHPVWCVDRRLSVAGEMTIYTAATLKSALFELLQSHPGYLDLSGVTELDTAGLQLILIARRCMREAGGELRIVEASAAVSEVLDLLEIGLEIEDGP
jgi:anti-sigma B factor antagonist